MYTTDPALKELLGPYPDRYSLDEKISIITAYKKGGGIAGLDDIIDDDDEDEDEDGTGA